MCNRYILVNTFEQIRKRFELPLQTIDITPNYNISAGQYAYVITDEKSDEVQLFKFGLTPFCAKREMLFINARSEGDYNKEDYPDFKGAKGIILKTAFRKPIRSQRCLVLASAFIEAPLNGGLSKPFLVYLRNHKTPFAMAGIWDTWLNPATLEYINSFSIITTTANSLIKKIGHSRMPVILSDNEEKKWLKPDTELSRITQMLNRYDSKLMNAYPIDPRIKDPAANDKKLIQPLGEKLLNEEDNKVTPRVSYNGHYQSKKRHMYDDSRPSWGEISNINRVKE
jgi:putative SOS response-associated peptidase YedK